MRRHDLLGRRAHRLNQYLGGFGIHIGASGNFDWRRLGSERRRECGVGGSPWESGVPRCSGENLKIVKAARQRLPNRLTLLEAQ